ncbi:MAG: hypothetical protein U9N72_08060 [Bacteroidota bacterium]|nr:hypothetical protein [Bacteroidota bacterium]
MNRYLQSTALILSLAVALFSCKQKEPEEIIPETTFSTYKADTVKTGEEIEKREIFYGLLTPVEITEIFSRLETAYNTEMLNPVENAENYMSASKTALNLGIYGVDLSYLKMFDMNTEMLRYLRAVHTLSHRLNIPTEYLTDPLEKIENSMSDTDSVLTLANTAYKRIEDHLEQSDRESTAGLMVLGGWIEALYISTQLLLDTDNPDPEVVQRIAEQKYTLNTLLSFLKNYYDDPVVVYYTKKLKFLKKYFDKFNIYFKKDDLEIDRDKQVFRASGSDLTITTETLRNIKDYAKKMREETVSL